jgi:non-ribosomal peptide synthetase component F
MTNTDKPYITSTRKTAESPDESTYIVAVNDLGQHAANQLEHHLRGRGIGPETLVGVCLERGIEAIRCLLAILKAGGAYLPLDPSLPAARLVQMCAEARPMVILVNRADAGAFSETDARLLLIDERAPEPADQPVTAPEVSLGADNIAYAVYTSGSTGRSAAPRAAADELNHSVKEPR